MIQNVSKCKLGFSFQVPIGPKEVISKALVLLGVVLGEVCEQPGVEGATFWFKRFFSRWWYASSQSSSLFLIGFRLKKVPPFQWFWIAKFLLQTPFWPLLVLTVRRLG